MILRPYQVEAYNAAISWIKKSVEPAIIEAAGGAGKSLIISAIAKTVRELSGKKILCLQPNAELLHQNRGKYLATGNPASVFSASGGGKCLRHDVIFATPISVKNKISRFGGEFSLIVLDEAHLISPSIIAIIDAIRLKNPKVRVIGLSATPMRLTSGYIYATDEAGRPVAEARDPYFAKRIYTITAQELIDGGWLIPPTVTDIGGEHYDTLSMQVNGRGKFDPKAVDQAYHGHGRKTAAIVAEIVAKCQNRLGVMLFAATIQHAEEVYASLPKELTGIVTSNTKKDDRKKIVEAYRDRRIKYLVNVGCFTTGFDVPHTDVVALLRKTESVSLLLQIIYRGMRLSPDTGKTDFWLMDYALNLEFHCDSGDIFNPNIKASFKAATESTIEVCCPSCGIEQEFSARDNKDGFGVSSDGYFLDLDGNKIRSEFGDIPAHHGRRCRALLPVGGGKLDQCGYRWTFKECPTCGGDNDIAARYCAHCRAELIDPNLQLRIEYKRAKKDLSLIQCDRIVNIRSTPMQGKSGPMLRVDIQTEYRLFSVWYHTESEKPWFRKEYQLYCQSAPHKSVTYRKEIESAFFKVLAYNQPPDEEPK
jgi:DNA repair protein RadD